MVSVVPQAVFAASSHADKAILQLIVNAVDKGEVLALLRSGDVLIRVAELDAAGIRSLDGTREFIGKEAYVSLSSLAPTVTYVLDEKALALRLTNRSTAQNKTTLDLTPTAPPGTMYSEDTSLFLNYAAATKGFNTYDAFGEAGLSVKGHLLASTVSRTEDGHIVRGLSNLTINDRDNLARWIIGDSFASSGALGGSAFVGGINIARNFTLDPYYYFFPRPGFAGTALTPSTVSVYSDGGLLRQETVAPGQFELQHLPVANGYRMNRVVIRDIFGRETEIASPFYLSTRVLQTGISEYNFSAGARRDNISGSSWGYDSPVMLARYRVGVTDDITPGVNLEADAHVVNGGMRMTAKSSLGEMDVSLAGSRGNGLGGSAGSLTYSFLQRWFSIGASVRGMSAQYATVSLPSTADRSKVEATGFIGVPIGPRVNVNLDATYAQFRDAGIVKRIGLSGNIRITDNLSLFSANSWSQQSAWSGSASRTTSYDIFVGLSYFFGNNTTGNLFTEKQKDHSWEGMRVQKSLPVGPGLGYRVEGTTGDDSHGLGQVQYQGQYGRYEALYDSAVERPSFAVSGGIVALGGSVHATRVVDDSFALIRAPGVPGMRGYVNNQEIGQTDSRGELIVPNNLISYYGNRISINDQDVPLDYRVDATEKTVATPFRGGAVVVFPVIRLQIITGTLTVETAGIISIPAYGRLIVTVADQTVESPIGKSGEFYLENVPAGKYHAVIENQEKMCHVTLDIPTSAEPFLKLGQVQCQVGAPETR